MSYSNADWITFAMNERSNPSLYIILCLTILLLFCLGMHFVHDIQPNYFEFFGSNSYLCESIHQGFFASVFPEILVIFLMVKIKPFYWQHPHSQKLSILLPPPIQ